MTEQEWQGMVDEAERHGITESMLLADLIRSTEHPLLAPLADDPRVQEIAKKELLAVVARDEIRMHFVRVQ